MGCREPSVCEPSVCEPKVRRSLSGRKGAKTRVFSDLGREAQQTPSVSRQIGGSSQLEGSSPKVVRVFENTPIVKFSKKIKKIKKKT
jgi:hypothetical protein